MEIPIAESDAHRSKLGAVETAFVKANETAVVAMAAIMVILVLTNVVCRYLLGFSVVWAEEVSQYLMVWVTFLGAGLALRQGRHVAVELLQDHMAPASKRKLRWGVLLAVLAFLSFVTVLGVMFSWFAKDMETPVLNISMAIPYAAVPIGGLLAAIHTVLIARAFVAGEHESSESIEAPVDEGEI